MSEDDWIQEDWKEDDWEHHEPVKKAEEPVNAGEPVEVEEPKPQPKIEEQKPAVEKVVEPSHVKPAQPSMNDEILQGVDRLRFVWEECQRNLLQENGVIKAIEARRNPWQHGTISRYDRAVFWRGIATRGKMRRKRNTSHFQPPARSWIEFQNGCRDRQETSES